MPGPPPTPTALKVLKGNPGKQDLSGTEPEPTKGAPRPPSTLKGEALAEWGRVVPELAAIGMVALIDRAALVMYCEAWSVYCDAMREIEERGTVIEGKNGPVKNPAFQVARDSVDTMVKVGSRFGMTPSDRARLSVKAADDGEGSEDAALRLLS